MNRILTLLTFVLTLMLLFLEPEPKVVVKKIRLVEKAEIKRENTYYMTHYHNLIEDGSDATEAFAFLLERLKKISCRNNVKLYIDLEERAWNVKSEVMTVPHCAQIEFINGHLFIVD